MPKDKCKVCGGTGNLTPSDMGACSDPDCCYQGDLECACGYEILEESPASPKAGEGER